MIDHNPHLTPRAADKGGPDSIEQPASVVNIPWQTRAAPPSAYENSLADALQAIFGAGVEELSELVRALNERGPKPQQGGAWTEASLAAELKRLAG